MAGTRLGGTAAAGFAGALAIAAAIAPAQDREAALRKAVRDEAPADGWIYDDIPEGLRVARKEGRPLLVVFR